MRKSGKKIKTKRGLRRWLFYKLNYGFYNGEPPTVEQCHKMYNNLLIRYALILDSKYWKIDVLSDLIDFLSRKKAYTVDEAVELYEKKFA